MQLEIMVSSVKSKREMQQKVSFCVLCKQINCLAFLLISADFVILA